MSELSTFYHTIMQQNPMLYKYQFTVEFIGSGLANESNIKYWAQSASIPAIEVVKAKTAYYGTEFRVPTTVKYEHDWTLKFLLDQNMTIYEELRNWMSTFSNLANSGGGQKVIPSITMKLNILDNTMTPIPSKTLVLVGCWPTNIGELKLEYKQDDTTAMTFDCKLKYQYCYFEEEKDPLTA